MSVIGDKATLAVHRYYRAQWDEKFQNLRSCVLWDLHFGPYSAQYYKETHNLDDWPGYVKAVEKLEEWATANINVVWVDLHTMEVLTVEPEMSEDTYGDYMHFDRAAVAVALFGDIVLSGGMSV